jgi:hypothetical protein
MGYVVAIIVVVIIGSVALASWYLSRELRPVPLPSRLSRGRVLRVATGDECVCGGTIGKSGKVSKRFGELLGCTACARLWTLDGRRVKRRRRSYAQQATGSSG